MRGHRSCAGHAVEGFMPTRLLELTKFAYRGEQRFRLVNSAALRPGMPYVTLSHCWGKGPPEKKLRLIKSTERLLRNGLPVSRLPRLFRDAVEIAGRLGVHYLWIDRLCIVQDSDEDWHSEAATMQTVYRNGFLNIAALGASDDRDGCFFERDPRWVAPTVLNLGPPSSEAAPLLYRFEAEDKNGWRPTFEGEPLLSRAWVLQERVLSARTLYFGRWQVFWECHEANRCETDPRRNLLQPSAARIPRTPQLPGVKPVKEQSSWKVLIETRGDHSGTWRTIVQSYSNCSLTFPSDKLIALSGLARDMSIMRKREGVSLQDNTYLAGDWRGNMPECLVWKMLTPGRRPMTYRAPSWSWASVDGFVVHRGMHHDGACLVDVLDAQTVPQGKDAMAGVVDGSIDLCGPLCVLADIKAVKRFPQDREYHLFRTFHDPDTRSRLNISSIARVDFDTTECYDEVTIVMFSCHSNIEWDHAETRGLALVPVHGNTSHFRRVGLFSFTLENLEEVIDRGKGFLDKVPVKTIKII